MDDENEQLLRKVQVSLQCNYKLDHKGEHSLVTPSAASQNTSDQLNDHHHTFLYHMCTVNLDSKVSWSLLDGIVSYVFKRYIKQVDAHDSLGLLRAEADSSSGASISIDKYYVGDMCRQLLQPGGKSTVTKFAKSNTPELLPFGYLVGDQCTIRIVLKDDMNNVDALAFAALTPKRLVDDYVRLLANDRLLAITSTHRFGKTYTMHKLAQFFAKK